MLRIPTRSVCSMPNEEGIANAYANADCNYYIAPRIGSIHSTIVECSIYDFVLFILIKCPAIAGCDQ